MTRAFISDCEGPISKNDNALEIMSHFVPNGDKIFAVTSRYDDALADILKRAGYKAGDTLKLVLPFLKAYDVTDRKIREYCIDRAVFEWPSGRTEEYKNLSTGRAFECVEGKGVTPLEGY